MVGTGAGDERTAGAKHLEGAQIEFFVAAKGSVEVALALGEGWRVQNDSVVLVAGRGVVSQQVESVSFNPFDLALIQGSILLGDFQGRAGTVYAGDFRTARRQMEGKAALIAEHIQGFAGGVLSSRGVVFALVEEGAGFLSFESRVVKADAVHG